MGIVGIFTTFQNKFWFVSFSANTIFQKEFINALIFIYNQFIRQKLLIVNTFIKL